ncbi:MAG: hypothetical protein HY377_01130 [Candidatus Blackburnbacteria bacterium]|nr:hypothetical protein [Candidatus Blackburnbacteria bacterium]
MNSVFNQFLNKGFKYNFQNGPDVITSEEQALEQGVNCIGLMHLLLKALFDVKLPRNLRVLEIYNENPYFKTIASIDNLEMGDILFLGKRELSDYISQYIPQYDENKQLTNENEGSTIIGDKHAGYHTVMYVGEKDSEGFPLVIDIEKITDAVKVHSLERLMENPRYEVLYKIKRPTV